MRTFMEFLELVLSEAPGDPPAPAAAGGIPTADPTGMPLGLGAPPGGGLGTPAFLPPGGPSSAGGAPPAMGASGGGAPPADPSQPAAGVGAPTPPPIKYKVSTVWDVLERILANKPVGIKKSSGSGENNVVNSPQLQPTTPPTPTPNPLPPTNAQLNPAPAGSPPGQLSPGLPGF
jgi:hypothetical protein